LQEVDNLILECSTEQTEPRGCPSGCSMNTTSNRFMHRSSFTTRTSREVRNISIKFRNYMAHCLSTILMTSPGDRCGERVSIANDARFCLGFYARHVASSDCRLTIGHRAPIGHQAIPNRPSIEQIIVHVQFAFLACMPGAGQATTRTVLCGHMWLRHFATVSICAARCTAVLSLKVDRESVNFQHFQHLARCVSEQCGPPALLNPFISPMQTHFKFSSQTAAKIITSVGHDRSCHGHA
jgi:hypothetical protein